MIFLVGIILIGVAVAIVERENYGLRYNHFRQEIETETSESGRYFAGKAIFVKRMLAIDPLRMRNMKFINKSFVK